MYEVFLNGTEVDLVVLTSEIAQDSKWYQWFNDEETTSTMQKHYFPNTREQQLEYFRSAIYGSKTHLQLGIVEKKEMALIGMISLSDIDYVNRHCAISGLIGEKKFRILSYWLEANRLILNHAFATLNLNRVYGGAISRAASQIYTRLLGFSDEGIAKDHVYKNGSFVDVYNFGCVKTLDTKAKLNARHQTVHS